MSLVTDICGTKYLPLRALPLASSGVLSASTVIHMIWNYEAFIGDEYELVLSPFLWIPNVGIKPIVHATFRGLSKKRNTTASLPAGMLVNCDAAEEKFRFMTNEILTRPGSHLHPAHAHWTITPQLTAANRALVFEGLPTPRSNSVNVVKAEIRTAIDRIKAICAKKGILLDEQNLPGNSIEWESIIARLAPSMTPRSKGIWKEHMKDMGIRWQQGRQQAQIAAIQVATSDLTPQSKM